jgi:UTP-glucose-1-phosphate uridylyltransferase/mevalonate kinase
MMNYHRIGGLKINCTKMTLPQKKGLSSSAAICVLTARAFNRIYGLNLTTRGEMECAYGGEQMTPSRCGRLDQSVAFGNGIIKMTFDADRLDTASVNIGKPLHFVFADLKVGKNTHEILRDLSGAYPYPKTEKCNLLHELLGVDNTQIVTDAVNAIAEGNAEKVGRLMNKWQMAFREKAAPLSPKELASPKLYEVLNDENILKWTYGGKGVGSQGDGTVQFIAKSKDEAEQLKQYLNTQLDLDSYIITVPKTSSVRKVVIPLGGYGTRMYPLTKVCKKEFMPVIDKDGLTKPVLLILLEELIKIGTEEICLVIRPGEEEQYYQLFEILPEQNLRKISRTLRNYEAALSKIQNRITFTYQSDPYGFGHAVLQSERFASHDNVMVLLGDHLFSSDFSKSCFEQLIDAFDKSGLLTIGLFEVPENDVKHYGIVKIKNESDGLLHLSEIIEKPVDDASHLMHNGKYYGVFMYVITPKVYDELSYGFSEWDGSRGEFQFTAALDSVTQKDGAVGIAINGKRYDVGLPEQYRKTVAEYGRNEK